MRTVTSIALMASILGYVTACRKLDVFSDGAVDGGQSDKPSEIQAFDRTKDTSRDVNRDVNWNAPLATAWVKPFGGPGVNEFVASGIKLDADGNIYFSSRLNGTAKVGKEELGIPDETHQVIIKLDSNGDPVWARQAGPIDIFGTSGTPGYALLNDGFSLDPAARASYLAGTFSKPAKLGTTTLMPVGKKDVYVAKLDQDGVWKWTANGGGPENEIVHDVTVIPGGVGNGVVIVGDFAGTAAFGLHTVTSRGGTDIFAAHLNSSTGEWNNVLTAGAAPSSTPQRAANEETAITVVPNGESLAGVYIGGMARASADFPPVGRSGASGLQASYVAKARMWNFASPATWQSVYPVSPWVMQLLPDRASPDLYGAGFAQARLRVWATDTTTGLEKWMFKPAEDPVGLQAPAFGIAQDVAGNLFVVGYFDKTLGLDANNSLSATHTDGFLLKLDQRGNLIWSKQVAAPAGGANCYGVTTGPDGSVYVTGFFDGQQASFDGKAVTTLGGAQDAFVWKLSR